MSNNIFQSFVTKHLIFYRVLPHTLCFGSWMLWHQKKKKKNFSLQIKNKFSNMKLNKEKHMFTVYQYHKLMSGHYVSHFIVLHRLLADVGVIFCKFVIPLEHIGSLSGTASAVRRKILVITSNFFCPLLSWSAHP